MCIRDRAGVEDVVKNKTLQVPLARMVDEGLTQGMKEWVLGHVMRHHLGTDLHVFGQGTQSRLNFLPEKHTDFIFTTLAEEFGFIGGISLLIVYALIVVFAIIAAIRNKDRFSSLLIYGVTFTFFLYFAVNMAMVMGLAPVVGVPLPLVSYGGSSLLVLMVAFGLLQSAHVHKPRGVI